MPGETAEEARSFFFRQGGFRYCVQYIQRCAKVFRIIFYSFHVHFCIFYLFSLDKWIHVDLNALPFSQAPTQYPTKNTRKNWIVSQPQEDVNYLHRASTVSPSGRRISREVYAHIISTRNDYAATDNTRHTSSIMKTSRMLLQRIAPSWGEPSSPKTTRNSIIIKSRGGKRTPSNQKTLVPYAKNNLNTAQT